MGYLKRKRILGNIIIYKMGRGLIKIKVFEDFLGEWERSWGGEKRNYKIVC